MTRQNAANHQEEILMKQVVASIVVVSLLVLPILSQAPSGPPKPGPENKALDYFVGSWTFEGEEKPSPFGPGGKFTGSETAEWFPGGFFLVSRSDSKSPMGEHKGYSVMGYNAEKKTYTFYMISSMGYQMSAEGTVAGKTWTWTHKDTMGGKALSGRFIMNVTSPTSYTMKYELSTDGGPYAVVMEGKATKKTS